MVLVAATLSQSACATLDFYHQAVRGQWAILSAREPIDAVLDDPATPPALAAQLRLVQDILAFAEAEIGLEAGGRYRSYVALDRPFVVWNVFASPPDVLDAETWCYPFVGCAPYRGYFAEADAQALAAQLQAQGLDTFVGGVPAYSTLGWFDDPVLSTFVSWREPELVNLLLHELAHSRVWVNGDVTFNESFATFVGDEATLAWFRRDGREAEYAAWRERRGAWLGLRERLLGLKARAAAADAVPAEEHARFRACYEEFRAGLAGAGQDRFDSFVARVNNAYLVSLGAYTDTVPAFAALFAGVDEQWPRFFARVEALGTLPVNQRVERLAALLGDAPARPVAAVAQQAGVGPACRPYVEAALDSQRAGVLQ